MANELSVADAMALTRTSGSSTDGFGGTWTWVFFLFFLLAWGGGGLFGGGSSNSPSTEGSLTRSALYESNNTQDIFRNMGELSSQINNFQTTVTEMQGNIRYDSLQNMNTLNTNLLQNTAALNNQIIQGNNALGAQIAQNRYAADAANCATNRNIDALKYELSKENCEGIQKIADMLTSNKIDTLQAQLADARNQITNLTQSASIINQVRPYPTPAYVVSSPYGSSSCGGGYISYGY